jgi:two-component system LytT family response regulator
MTIKCIIIDDEPLAAEIISDYVSKFENFRLIAQCSDAVEAFAIVKQTSPDLLFLDIEMPEINGLNFIRSLKNPPAVILTTAYREYAADAFDLDVVDYLLKPISFKRFMRAIDRFIEFHQKKNRGSEAVEISGENYLSVYSNGRTHQVEFDKILYIESMGDYVKINLFNNTLITRETLSSLEQKLPENLFIRIHRSFIVSITHIDSYTKSSIQVGSITIPISRKYKEVVIRKFKGN